MLERRTVLVSLAALPATMLMACVPDPPAAEVPLAFDPAAFVADLKAAGYVVLAYRAVPRGGEHAEPPSYLIRPPKGRGFGALYTAVMDKWWDAMDACPNHVERVAAHVFGQIGRAA